MWSVITFCHLKVKKSIDNSNNLCYTESTIKNNHERVNDDMANNNKTDSDKKSFVAKAPHTVKTIVVLVEVVARLLAAYLLLNNFSHIVAVAAGWYFLITAAMAFVALVHKASK